MTQAKQHTRKGGRKEGEAPDRGAASDQHQLRPGQQDRQHVQGLDRELLHRRGAAKVAADGGEDQQRRRYLGVKESRATREQRQGRQPGNVGR